MDVRLAFDKHAIGTDLFAPKKNMKECVHEDVEWEAVTGDTCTDLLHAKQSDPGTWDQVNKCQLSDMDNAHYVYDKCNCLECEPVVCDGAWHDFGCTEGKGWGE